MCGVHKTRKHNKHTRTKKTYLPDYGIIKHHWSSVGTGARWRHRGALQDALGGTLRTFLGAGNGPSPLPLPHLALFGRNHRQTNRLYRRMRIGAAHLEPSRNNEERFQAPGYACVPRADWLPRYHDTVPPKGSHVWYKGDDGFWWLGKSAQALPRTRYTWSASWTTRDRLNFLFPRRATRLQREPYGVLGACKFTSPVRFLGESNVT